MRLGVVGAENRAALETFTCATTDAPSSLVVEELVRRGLVDELAAGHVRGLGSWDGSRLAAVIAFTHAGPLWKVVVLATDVQYRHQRQAIRLKRAVLAAARAAGAVAVTSRVDRDNNAMQSLNLKLGGVVESPADPDDPYDLWTIPLL